MFMAILVTCLNTIVSKYIHQDQSGFIPARSVTDNIRKTFNIMKCFKDNQTEAAVLALDIEEGL